MSPANSGGICGTEVPNQARRGVRGLTQRANPGFNGALKIANSLRVAISIYRPGDLAPTHMHTPNASRTILSDKGGYSEVEGEKCPASRGDLILTPNGTWHGHGNDDDDDLLAQAMERHGFRGLPEEWWHFTLKAEPFPDTWFDFPVTAPGQ